MGVSGNGILPIIPPTFWWLIYGFRCSLVFSHTTMTAILSDDFNLYIILFILLYDQKVWFIVKINTVSYDIPWWELVLNMLFTNHRIKLITADVWWTGDSINGLVCWWNSKAPWSLSRDLLSITGVRLRVATDTTLEVGWEGDQVMLYQVIIHRMRDIYFYMFFVFVNVHIIHYMYLYIYISQNIQHSTDCSM